MTAFLCVWGGIAIGVFLGYLIFRDHGFSEGYRAGLSEGYRQAWMKREAFKNGTGDLYRVMADTDRYDS